MQLEVLLVEDSPTDALFIRESLAALDPTRYAVLTVDRLAAAETMLASHAVDVALLDLGLPDSNGIGTFLQLHRAQPDLPVLVLTGLDDEQTALRAMQAGAQDYLPKDQLSPNLLHRSIRYAVERNRVTRALRETEARFRELAETIREVFWLTDPGKSRIIYISPGYEAIWGRPSASLYQDSSAWLDAIHPDDRGRVLAALPRQAQGTYDEEYRIIRPDGAVRWIRDQAFPVRGEGGEVLRIAGVAEDVTERRHLEAQLRQTQKMESIGQLAGGIAHDFNNWLTVIAGNIELLQVAGAQEGETPDLLAEIHHATERASALTRQLLAFSRREVIEPKITDLNLVVIEAEKVLRRLLGEDIVLTTVLAADLAKVRVDPGQWSQVLLNLAVNARDAMPHGGELTIESRNMALDEDYARLHPGVSPGPYVALTVTDSGEGIPPEIRQRIFEPFFTTKERGRGTGLGLSVVHGIVSQAGGYLEADSEPGRGTTFRMYLPAVLERAQATGGPAETRAVAGTETLLLVEDEESIRRVSARGLRQHGYQVLVAANGIEALERLAQHGGQVDMVITDVVMPRMDGPTLVEAVRQAHPGLRVLYTSGYTDDAVVRRGVQRAEVAFLSKPYTPMVLLRKIRQVLDEKGGER